MDILVNFNFSVISMYTQGEGYFLDSNSLNLYYNSAVENIELYTYSAIPESSGKYYFTYNLGSDNYCYLNIYNATETLKFHRCIR